MTIKQLFDMGAAQYDGQRRKVIPCFDDFYKTAIDLIPFDTEDTFTVLDLGAGTGLLTALILNAFPKASSMVLDISEKMLAKAKERFKDNDQVHFCAMDYARSPLTGDFDLIVSAMSIHHLYDSDKRLLFKKIYNALLPGGMFIHAELAKGATDVTEKIYQRMWFQYLKKTDLTEDQLSLIFERMSYDKTTTLDIQLKWLKKAGFMDVDCFYKYYNFAVYAGRKLII
ncbi:MAG: hypothetical protein B1H12_03180 [Desulfobacteraceae bacterium 4484_190.2]|nr:MAG: hypothetical protein B1H12_03180 [Desulfobacteraceae bacterium 4484_190.2]